MSDSWVLCPKCGEEVEYFIPTLFVLNQDECYYCSNCKKIISSKDVRKVTTEYLKGEEDEKSNQSRRSKK